MDTLGFQAANNGEGTIVDLKKAIEEEKKVHHLIDLFILGMFLSFLLYVTNL